MLKVIMRIFSYLYHLVLGIFLCIVGLIAVFGGRVKLSLEMLPWQDPTLKYVVLFGGLLALGSLALVLWAKSRILFRLWTVAVFVLLTYGYFLTRYGFKDSDQFRNAVLFTLGALIAMLGAWTKVRKRA